MANRKTVSSVLDTQRKDGEARSLLQDLEKLISLKGDRRLRWVWELIQNAKDCAIGKKVNIYFALSKDKLLFQHDGVPFQIEQLIALVRKTSTKSIEGLEGNTGKFGTGFVTTHVLNSKVTVSGLLQNDEGYRPFRLLIDRSFDTLPGLMQSLEKAYEDIDAINDTPASSEIGELKTSYEYNLEEHKFAIAKDGLAELERNISFTMLINQQQLSSVTIAKDGKETVLYSLEEPQEVFPNIGFSKIQNQGSNSDNGEQGLLFQQTPELTIAFPTSRNGNNYTINKISEQARIFRDFPLIGTEKSHFPCFIHSNLFQPTEPRDGIRTLKDREDRPDKHADENRGVLNQYVILFKSIFNQLNNNNVNNLHLLAESGLPEDNLNYLAQDWFISEIQGPIREFMLLHDLVKTVDGPLIKIENARFIRTYDYELEAELYLIVSNLFPTSCPDNGSYKDWQLIMEQDEDYWLKGTRITVEDVVKEVERKGSLDELRILENNEIEWLNKLILYIIKSGNVELTEQYAIYPNQSRQFRKRLGLKLDPGFDDKFKKIAKDIFRNLNDDLILEEITYLDGIQKFETDEFFLSINNFIGVLDVKEASNEQISAIFELGCYFKEANAPKRNEWFDLLNILLPGFVSKKCSTPILEEYNFEPADKWTLKYVSMLIENSKEFSTFKRTYFEEDGDKAYDWLNRFLAFVCRNEESRDVAFKYSIILTQDGKFKKNENLIREDKPLEFESIFKDMIKDYLGKGDPREYLIDTKISNDSLVQKGVDYLTEQIDKLFSETETEHEIEEGEKLNPLFHLLNDWYGKEEEKEESRGKHLFPIFSEKRPKLSVRAYGKEMSKMVIEKGFDEIKALSKLKLKSAELTKLEEAAELAGGTQVLLDIAQEIFNEAERIRWRREVGTAAEKAFLEAMQDIETKFNIENPDIGKDFTIISKTTGKEFYVEIKSTVIGEEAVKMSSLQGHTANMEKHRYALCVITRPSGTLIDKEYFIEHVKFVPTIGELIGDKLVNMLSDLKNLSAHEIGDDVKVRMDDKTYSVYVNRKIWEGGISFSDFLVLLKECLNTPETKES